MKKQQKALTWTEVNPETLHADAKSAYEALLHQNAKSKVVREKFEKSFTKGADLPDTHRFIFSYKFGQLSVAVDVAKPTNRRVSSKAKDFNSLKVALRDKTNT